MVQKIEKVIAKTFYNEIFSSIERFIGRNRNQIKVLKCNLDDINFISLDDFEVRRILSTHRVNRKLKSYLQVIASVEAKGRNRYGYESEDGEIWITVSVSYRLEDGFKEFRVEGVSFYYQIVYKPLWSLKSIPFVLRWIRTFRQYLR